jgi:hypothetical protein
MKKILQKGVIFSKLLTVMSIGDYISVVKDSSYFDPALLEVEKDQYVVLDGNHRLYWFQELYVKILLS